jgi:homoserine kinase
MKKKKVTVYAPASISNLGSGFDVLGLAIDRPGDFVTAERGDEPGIEFMLDSTDANLPVNKNENVAVHVASLMLDDLQPGFGVRITLHKRMPVGSGLGSSAASSVAAVYAVNALLPRPMKKERLLEYALEGERKVTGITHADNVAPSLFGGACLIRSYSPLDVVPIPVRNSIVWTVVHPKCVVKTRDARSILPQMLSLSTAVAQWGNVGGMSVALTAGDAKLAGKCTEDIVAEPVRAQLVPGFREVKDAALNAGACGCTLSGSGPSMFAIASSVAAARRIGRAMVDAFRKTAGVSCDMYISRINMRGAEIVDESEIRYVR